MKKTIVICLGAWIVFSLSISTMIFAAEPYKVGAVWSLTGRASFLGDPSKKTALLVAEEINSSGGINGHNLELVIYDDEGDATKCILAVKKLIRRDKVCAIIGPNLTGLTLAIIPVVEKNEVPLISNAASYKIVHNEKTGKPYKWVFKTVQTDNMAVEAIYTHIKRRGINKIAIMSVTTGFGASGREQLIMLAPKYGMTIVADEKYGPKDTDMTAQLTRIKGKAPQAIVNWSIGPTQVVVLRNRRDLGMVNTPFYQSHGFGSRENIRLSAGAAEGILCPLGAVNIPLVLPSGSPQKNVVTKYNKDYKDKFNEPVSTFGGHAWDALYLVVNALKDVGNDSALIRNHIENAKNFIGQHGIFNMSPDDHMGLIWQKSFNMVVVKNGDWALAD